MSNEYRTNLYALDGAREASEREKARDHELELEKLRTERVRMRWSTVEGLVPPVAFAAFLAACVGVIVALCVYGAGLSNGRQEGLIECLQGRK